VAERGRAGPATFVAAAGLGRAGLFNTAAKRRESLESEVMAILVDAGFLLQMRET